MATVVSLPRLSDTMEEGVIAKWHIAVGDKVKRGQMIAEIETDKATMEFESFDAGVVLELVAAEGQALPIGAPIAVFGKEGEDPKAALGGGASKPAAKPAGKTASKPAEADASSKEAAAKPAKLEKADKGGGVSAPMLDPAVDRGSAAPGEDEGEDEDEDEGEDAEQDAEPQAPTDAKPSSAPAPA
ncbi:MAG: dihydrolipoamide acetyltransferase, partial [Deltaproteobacteria bacterium]|nr:dihydrolipoamide acetyltransferase [Nannocystaceae bacterium]